jgi:hemerythrin-like domain-containing protein
MIKIKAAGVADHRNSEGGNYLCIMADEIKPIKRSPQLAPLSREHHEGLLLVWKIQQGLRLNVDAERIRQYILWYWQNHIKPHFYQEEKILQPYIPAGNELLQRMMKEHEQIREFILSLDKEADNSTFSNLASLLDSHIRFEERQLFGYLEQVLSKDQMDKIFTELEQHPVCNDQWKDEFWLRNKQ